MRQVRDRGTSILYVSHRLDEIIEVADRVTVLRGGRVVETRTTRGLDPNSLAAIMAGDEVGTGYRAMLPSAQRNPVVLSGRNLSGRYLDGVFLELHEGEILGVAGLPGSGSAELAPALAGVLREATGEVRLGEGPVTPVSRAARLNLPIVPSDRLQDAVLPGMTVGENLSIGILERLRTGLSLSHRREHDAVANWMDNVRVTAAGGDAPITTLSGGNQQKVMIARCLAREPRVLLLCDPTAGVDPAARQAIHEMVAERARQGLAILVTSADIGDLLAMCTRVLVLCNGKVVRELIGHEITEHGLIRAMEETEQR